MSLIYEPRGRAREYAALALNTYTGCSHGCQYCFAIDCAPADMRRLRFSTPEPVWTERLLLRLVKALYSHRLREMVAVLPPELTAEILAAFGAPLDFSYSVSGVILWLAMALASLWPALNAARVSWLMSESILFADLPRN